MKEQVRIGCFAAFWGDTKAALGTMLRGSEVDYLVADYLAEITMALLARGRAKDPDGGFIADAIDTLVPHLGEIHERGIKVVTNAGGLNPAGWAAAFEAAAAEAGVPLRVAAVEGDDLLPRKADVLAECPEDMFTGQPVPAELSSLNAYLGARPIAAALAAGADVVVTGRCADAAVVLGPLMQEFGWSDEDYDLLAAGSLIGHIVECGPQCAGGIFTDWASVPGWDNMGYPIAECRPDGTAVITKPADTGGLVTAATVSEQIVYEIGDPGAYVMPDVVCDWREVELRQEAPDRVHVSGARGRPPTTRYKVTATHADGYRAMTTAMFAGVSAGGRARRAGEALVARAGRLIAERGFEPLEESSIEIVGDESATSAVVKVGVRHPRREALEIFAGEFAPMALVAQGMSGTFAGRPRPAPVIRVFHLLASKDATPVRVTMGGESFEVKVAPGASPADAGTPALEEPGAGRAADGVPVPLHRIAYGRSGDKGNLANIGLIARRPEFAAIIRDQVTAERVAEFFSGFLAGGGVKRWELPGIAAVNIVLPEVLGGTGGTSTLRYDPQGKSYAAMLLGLPVSVPREWERDGILAAPEAKA